MKIGGINKKPKIAEESSNSDEDEIPNKNNNINNNKNINNSSYINNKNNKYNKNSNNKDLSTEILISQKSLLPKPGTSIYQLNNNNKISLTSKKVISSNISNNLKSLSKIDDTATTTINSDRFNFITENFKNQQKKLDNSYEDYWFYEIVDDESFLKFKTFVKEYISRRLFDKVNKLYINLRKQLSDTIAQYLNNIRSYSDIIEKIINQHCNKKVESKSCFETFCSCCKCCKKKKKKNKLISYYDMRSHAYRLCNSYSDLAQEIKENYNEKAIEEIFPNPTDDMRIFCEEKAQKFLDKPTFEERLREEVEYYSKYFKIENILEKQKNTLQQQEEKKIKINGIRDLNTCIICMEEQRSIMFSPCHHLICCEKCANDNIQDVCPECKKIIVEKIDINS